MKEKDQLDFTNLVKKTTDVSHLETIETHISIIFITDYFVYKIKKNVSFPFLNYSTLELRRYYIKEEIRLNRRLAKDVYISYKGIYRDSNSNMTWKKTSDLIEWVLVMRRLPARRMLDKLILNGSFKLESLIPLAHKLKNFYQTQRLYHLSGDLFFETLKSHCLDNYKDFRALKLTKEQMTKVKASVGRQIVYLLKHKHYIYQRVQKGCIVEGHGDLKPEHICMTDPPVVFDCIEFSQEYRTLDILDELSFFKLETIYLGQKFIGERLVSEILTLDLHEKQMSNFYVAYRGLVRAKVERIKERTMGVNHGDSIQRYLSIAQQYSHKISRKMLIFVAGLMGSGKTTLAKSMASVVCGEYLSTDEIRAQYFGIYENENHGFNQGKYTAKKRDQVYTLLFNKAIFLLKRGLNVILDGSFISDKHRALIYDIAQDNKAEVLAFWCECPDQIAIRRIEERRNRSNSASQARAELYVLQKKEYQNMAPVENAHIIETENHPDTCLEQALNAFQDPNIHTPEKVS